MYNQFIKALKWQQNMLAATLRLIKPSFLALNKKAISVNYTCKKHKAS